MIPAVIERCAGTDVGKAFVAVCVMIGPAAGEAQAEIRKYGTMNSSLEQLREWLEECGCTHVVMESTGAYWKPTFHVLEQSARLQIVLANSQQVKGLGGHKTGPSDSHWLAHLLRHGMIRASFIPPRPIRELRALTRRRKQLVRAGAQERNRVQKEMEECNIKLGNVLSDVFGLSGQLMQEALVEGTPGRRAGTIGTDEQGTTGALARAIRLPGNKLLDTFCLFATLPTTNDCTRRSKRHRASRALRIKHD